jgi:formylglycine-generating enzyme required for sulfatase activity
VNKKARLVLLGDPGSGKSTFINYVMLCMAGELLGREDVNIRILTQPLQIHKDDIQSRAEKVVQQSWDQGALLPVRIILRDFAVRGLPNIGQIASAKHIWKFIKDELDGAALSEYIPFLKKELRDQGGLLLFDGLDEVPEVEQRREQIKQAIESFVSTFPRCRFVVTSRTYAYQNQNWKLNGFSEAILAPYTKAQIIEFVDRWYAHIARARKQNVEDAKGKAALLKRAIISNDRLMGLAERPLLLTLMASLHVWRGGTLPEKREELYSDAVDLLLDWWESQRVVRDGKGNAVMIQPSLAEWLKVDRKKVRDLLNKIAYDAHAGQSEIVGTADVPESILITGLMNLSQNPDLKPARLIEYIRDRAGLLISRGMGIYTFPHRTFQEYLAACYLTDHDYPDLIARLARTEPDRWREIALLAGAKAARGAADFALWALADALSPEMETEQDDSCYWGAHIAGQAVVEIANLEKASDSSIPKVNRLRTRLLNILEGECLAVVERAQAGINLAMLDDPRFQVDLWHLPADDMLGFIRIPSGKFLMGSDRKQDKSIAEYEGPQHELDLPYDYYVARYPVTVAQYKSFIEQTGYKTPYEKSLLGVSNHPVSYVTWYDAMEYCRWLSAKMKALSLDKLKNSRSEEQFAFWQGLTEGNLHLSLPSEAEWEKAARGMDGRIYPWGNDFDSNCANIESTGIGMTTTVGCFSSGSSPYGVMDMSGNVWEWTRSLWEEYPYVLGKAREDVNAPNEIRRVVRGGHFGHRPEIARCACRHGSNPNFLWAYNVDLNYGFRLVVSPMLLS